MEIDLIKLLNLNLNINEYLTLIKIDKSKNNINFPFTSTDRHLESLEEKGYINIDQNKVISFTDKGYNIVNPKENINFDELFELYPTRTPNGRILRTKNKEIKGRLTKEYKFLKQKYLLRVKDSATHQEVIKATQKMLNERKRNMSLDYLMKLEVYINKEYWQTYMDEDGEVEDTKQASDSFIKRI